MKENKQCIQKQMNTNDKRENKYKCYKSKRCENT